MNEKTLRLIANSIPAYPELDAENFTYELSRKREFAENYLGPSQSFPEKQGDLLDSQKFAQNFINPNTPYTKILGYQGVGSGKCVHPETLISTNYGTFKAHEIWDVFRSNHVLIPGGYEQGEWSTVEYLRTLTAEPRPEKDLVEGDRVEPSLQTLALSQTSGLFEMREIRRLYRQLVHEDLLKVTLEDGSSVTVTTSHKLFDGETWTLDFDIGTSVAVPSFVTLDISTDVRTYREKFATTSEKNLGLSGSEHEDLPVTPRRSPSPSGSPRYTLMKIVQIERVVYCGYVYDFEVAIDHNYIAGGILCHNTCLAAVVVENFKNTLVGGEKRKPALIVVKNDGLRLAYLREIARVCTAEGTYKPKLSAAEEAGLASLSAEAIEARLNRDIGKTFEIVTVEVFLSNLGTDEQIRKLHSYRVIVIDEAHAVREHGGDSVRTSKPETESKKRKSSSAAAVPEGKKSRSEGAPAKTLYSELKRFLHVVEGARILLLSGTPIWDQTYEIASLMNLILDLDKQLPTGAKFNRTFFNETAPSTGGPSVTSLKPEMVRVLREAFRGRVSFLRPGTTSSRKEEIGVTQPWTLHRKIYPVAMSSFQAKYAEEAKLHEDRREVTVGGKTSVRVTKGGEVYKLARGAMNMVLPVFDSKGNVVGGEYGSSAMKKYVVENREKGRIGEKKTIVSNYAVRGNLARELKNNLAKYSIKFAAVIDDIIAHPNEVTFVSNEVVGSDPGGAIMFGLCLELRGFKWVRTVSAMESPSATKRFVVLTGEGGQSTSNAKQIRDIIESLSKPDNRYGERLQVIIGSKKVSLGLSFFNVRKFWGIHPNWNIPSEEQAKARIMRFGGERAFPLEERYVKIYFLCALEEGKLAQGKGYPPEKGFSPKETIDVYIYRRAEEKEFRNTLIYRVMKEEAVDGAINYGRNVLEGDVEGSRDCDYQKCNYYVSRFPRDKIDRSGKVWSYEIPLEDQDFSTYSTVYAQSQIRVYSREILEIFSQNFAMHIDSLASRLGVPEEEKPVLYRTLQNLINTRTPLRDKLGFQGILMEQGNIIYVESKLTPNATYANSAYVATPYVHERSSMDTIVENMLLDRDVGILREICGDDISDEEKKRKLEREWEGLSHSTKIILFESSFVLTREGGEPTPVQKFVLNEMIGELFKIEGKYYHILYADEFTGTSYNVGSKELPAEGKTRVFVPKGKSNPARFENVVDPVIESSILKKIKDSESEKKRSQFEGNEYGIIGWLSKKDKSFKIELQGENRFGKKGLTKGLRCKNFDIPKLLNIFIERIKYLPPADKIYSDRDATQLIRLIRGRAAVPEKYRNAEWLAGKSEKELRQLLTLFSMTNDQLCVELEKWLDEKKLLSRR